MVVAIGYDTVVYAQVCVVQGAVPVLFATLAFHQLTLELRHEAMSDQHFRTSGSGLAQLIEFIGRWVSGALLLHVDTFRR